MQAAMTDVDETARRRHCHALIVPGGALADPDERVKKR
jgi:hypothetical protein